MTTAVAEPVSDAAKETRSRQLLVIGVMAVVLVMSVIAFGTGYALGAHAPNASMTHRQTEANTADAAQVARALRSLPVETRYELQAVQLRALFSDSIFPVARVGFARIAVPHEQAPTAGSDVTLVTSTDAPWRRLTRDERELMLAALAASHQRFLSASGERDTTAFAAMLAVRDANGVEHVLGLRDREGRLYVQ